MRFLKKNASRCSHSNIWRPGTLKDSPWRHRWISQKYCICRVWRGVVVKIVERKSSIRTKKLMISEEGPPRIPKGAQRGPKGSQGGPQRVPKDSKKGPKGIPNGPNGIPKGPKGFPKGPREESKRNPRGILGESKGPKRFQKGS